MSTKLLWTGVTFILALTPALDAFGLRASGLIITVGAILMLIGLVLLWLDK